MSSSIRTLVLVSLASLGWAVSFGLGAQLAPLWLADAGLDASTRGLNTSFYYLGVAIASPVIPLGMRRFNRLCVVVGMLLDAITTAVFPFCQGILVWHLLRFLGGVGTALSLIPMETLVNHNAAPEHRARDFGFYAFCVALGIGLGAWMGLPLYPHVPHLAFILAGLITLGAIVLAWLATPKQCSLEKESCQSPLPWRSGVFSLGTAWAQGFLEGGSLTFLASFLLFRGFTESATGNLVGCMFVGVILAQLPLSWLADRLGRIRVLIACHLLLGVGLLLLPLIEMPAALGITLLVVGACCGALYPLGLAVLGDRLPAADLACGNAWYLTSNCAGSLSGPLLIGLAIDAFGLSSQFVVGIAAIASVLAMGLLLDRPPARTSQSVATTSTPRAA